MSTKVVFSNYILYKNETEILLLACELMVFFKFYVLTIINY